MKILITGGSGFLGQYLNLELSKLHEIFTLWNSNIGNCKDFPNAQVDLTDYDLVKKTVSDFSPEILIHTAGVTSPQQADSLGAKLVNKINVAAVKNLAELCSKKNIKLIYTSTDLVYAGYRGKILKENAKLIPASLYAESKLMGEEKIKQVFDNYIILRTALLYGIGIANTESHFQQMYNKLKAGEKVNLFNDQFRTPLSVNDAARIIGKIVSLPIEKETINLGGKERLSRLELGEKLCDAAGFDKKLINPVSLKDFPNIPQVEDVSMDTEKLQSFGIRQMSVDESLQEILLSKNFLGK